MREPIAQQPQSRRWADRRASGLRLPVVLDAAFIAFASESPQATDSGSTSMDTGGRQTWFKYCAGECFWACVAAAAALAMLCVFVLVVEAGGDTPQLREMITSPINLVRFATLWALLALLGYITRVAGNSNEHANASAQALGAGVPEACAPAQRLDDCDGAAPAAR